MFPTASLTALLLLAVSVAANPIVARKSAPINLSVKGLVTPTSGQDVVQRDQDRAKQLYANGKAKEDGYDDPFLNVGVTNAVVSYLATVGVGFPPTDYNLIIDTGSSNTWVGAGKPYVKTLTSEKTHDSVSVTYGSGSFSGTEFLDTVALSDELFIVEQSIGVASTSTGFPGVDGILGIGPTDLTVGTLNPDTKATIPTVTDRLFSEEIIPEHSVAVSFEPTTSESEKNGQLTFGAVDNSKFTGQITFVPITGTSPANQFWGIDECIKYGATTILDTTAGIVDTGTTLLLIATDAFQKYQSATGGTPDSATGLLTVTPAQYDNLKSIYFTVGGTSFEFTANAQIWPRSLNSVIGGVPGGIYLIVADLGTNSGAGLDFILGQVVLERLYSVYDTGNQRVGLATTPFTTATSN